jgi:hypothetical protein
MVLIALLCAEDSSCFFSPLPAPSTTSKITRLAPRFALGKFDRDQMISHLEKDMRADLAILAKKFGKGIEDLEGIEDLHVTSVDGDTMRIAVVYCEDHTCVAVEVPIAFPRHCDTEAEVDDVIHELEERDISPEEIEAMRTNARLGLMPEITPAMLQTMQRIVSLMNSDFEDELLAFAKMFGSATSPIIFSQMVSLSPVGMKLAVKSADSQEDVINIRFSKPCETAGDFQNQILELSERCRLLQ